MPPYSSYVPKCKASTSSTQIVRSVGLGSKKSIFSRQFSNLILRYYDLWSANSRRKVFYCTLGTISPFFCSLSLSHSLRCDESITIYLNFHFQFISFIAIKNLLFIIVVWERQCITYILHMCTTIDIFCCCRASKRLTFCTFGRFHAHSIVPSFRFMTATNKLCWWTWFNWKANNQPGNRQ